MKIQVVSDLHCEFRMPDVVAVADVIVAGGDIGARKTALPLIDDWLSAGAEVVMVLGNHEFYGGKFHATLKNWREWDKERPKFHVLDRDAVIIDGVRFLGATLWTDFNRGNPSAMSIGSRYMADFHVIRYRRGRLQPADTVRMHRRDCKWIAQQLALPHDGPTVVVTHHLPHPKSIAPQFEGSELNPAFASDLDQLIRTGKPDVWVHGHTHTGCDYTVHDTRIVCNPLGYPNERFVTFDPALVIEV